MPYSKSHQMQTAREGCASFLYKNWGAKRWSPLLTILLWEGHSSPSFCVYHSLYPSCDLDSPLLFPNLLDLNQWFNTRFIFSIIFCNHLISLIIQWKWRETSFILRLPQQSAHNLTQHSCIIGMLGQEGHQHGLQTHGRSLVVTLISVTSQFKCDLFVLPKNFYRSSVFH
jgi:hypothetical protein